MTGPTVLIVDDDPVSVVTLVQRLEAMSFATATARSGREAIQRITAHPPDVIMLDVVTPEMDGIEVCRWIQSRPDTASIPVIFLSARGALDDRAAALLLGVRDYLLKPLACPVPADRVGGAAHNKRQADALRKPSYAERDTLIDPLTRVLNRRGLQTHLLQEIARAHRYATPLSCLMLDVDQFKAINDRFGPARGDEALMELASSLIGCCRPTDFVARYGGEEFTVLLPHTPREGALACAERIRSCIADRTLAGLATVSLGVAQWTPGEDAYSLLERADGTLFEAKAAGGNCIGG